MAWDDFDYEYNYTTPNRGHCISTSTTSLYIKDSLALPNLYKAKIVLSSFTRHKTSQTNMIPYIRVSYKIFS